MSSQAGFVTKNGNLSAKALKRIFKDGVQPKKLPKRQKIVKMEPTEAPEEKSEEIMEPNIASTSEEELDKRRRLDVAVEYFSRAERLRRRYLQPLLTQTSSVL